MKQFHHVYSNEATCQAENNFTMTHAVMKKWDSSGSGSATLLKTVLFLSGYRKFEPINKAFLYFLPKNLSLKLWEICWGQGSRKNLSGTLDPGVKKAPDPEHWPRRKEFHQVKYWNARNDAVDRQQTISPWFTLTDNNEATARQRRISPYSNVEMTEKQTGQIQKIIDMFYPNKKGLNRPKNQLTLLSLN